jgi:hypothetical protein
MVPLDAPTEFGAVPVDIFTFNSIAAGIPCPTPEPEAALLLIFKTKYYIARIKDGSKQLKGNDVVRKEILLGGNDVRKLSSDILQKEFQVLLRFGVTLFLGSFLQIAPAMYERLKWSREFKSL